MLKLKPTSQASDEFLASQVLNGKRTAWEELYDRYFDVLFRFCYGYVQDAALAEDVVQDLFIELPESLKKFDTTRRFKTWCFTLAANRCKNVIRNRDNRSRISQSISVSTTFREEHGKNLDIQTLKSEIKQVLAGCSDKERELYHLRFEMDMNIGEIAEMMNIPEGSVKSGLFYLLKKIRIPLKKISHEYE